MRTGPGHRLAKHSRLVLQSLFGLQIVPRHHSSCSGRWYSSFTDTTSLGVQAKITPKYDPKAPQPSLAESAFTRRRELFVGRLAVRPN